MKKTLFALAAVAALALSSTAAMAEGFYAGASVGTVNGKIEGLGDDNQTGAKLHYGYSFNQNLAVELGYAHLGSYSIGTNLGTAKGRVNALFADVVGTYPLANNFSLLGRVGIARLDGKVSLAGVGSDKDTDVNFKVGAGLQYDISPSLAVRGEWEHYRADFSGVKAKANAFSIGLNYKFN